MLLDKYAPAYDYTEVHSIQVKAQPEAVYRALWETTMGEIHILVRILFGLRGLPEKMAGRHQNPLSEAYALSDDQALMQQLLKDNFVLVEEQAPREIVFGLLVPGNIGRVWQKNSGYTPPIRQAAAFLAFNDPAFLHVLANFTVDDAPQAGYVIVRTESRTRGCSEWSRKSFRPYWFIIRPWSGLIRRLWLKAIKQRAEAR